MKKFKTLLSVKLSLITLYLSLTFPIVFITNDNLKLLSIICFVLGLIFTFGISNDYVLTDENRISLKTNFIATLFGKKSWEIFWKDIKQVKSFPTSQGSNVYYLITTKESFLIPQRLEKFKEFKKILFEKINFKDIDFDYISPLWTYKLLIVFSSFIFVGEIYMFLLKLNLNL